MLNIQQLPYVILVLLIEDLEWEYKLILLYCNKFFNSIVAPILYKDLIYFRKKPDNEELELEVDKFIKESCFNQHDEENPNYPTFLNSNLSLTILSQVKDFSRTINKKTWISLTSTLVKYSGVVVAAKPVDPDNFLKELEVYPNLKQYEIEVTTKEQVLTLIKYRGPLLNRLKKLELSNDGCTEYEAELLEELREQDGVEQQILDDYDYPPDINCATLTNQFFVKVNCNFPNLKKLEVHALYYEQPDPNVQLTTFTNLANVSICIEEDSQNLTQRYMNDATYWPKVRSLTLLTEVVAPLQLTGEWEHLSYLSVGKDHLPDPQYLNRLEHLHSLELDLDLESDCRFIPNFLAQLTRIRILKVSGSVPCSTFDFQPKFQLRKIRLGELTDFTNVLITFIQTQTQCRLLELDFNSDLFQAFNNNNQSYPFLQQPSNLHYLTVLKLKNAFQQLTVFLLGGTQFMKIFVHIVGDDELTVHY